ncbi:MAG: cytochrome b N-terminal domain-containing protein [Bacteroidota bacterium]
MPNKKNKWNNLILHLHPKLIPEKAIKYTLTWGLGGMAALQFVLLAFTGILLRFVYVPTPESAYDSILYMQNEMLFGNYIRNIHHWSGTLLVLIVFLHMLRVLFTGAYNQKRGSNWIIGVCLLLLVIASNFSGYLLPWDQLAYWAITVSTSMLNYVPLIGEYLNKMVIQGSEVGDATLLVFYNMHTGLLPLTMVILMGFHFWKIRKAGGVVIPQENDEEEIKKIPVIPNLVTREFVVALFLLAFVFLLATFFDAPLVDEANPLVTPNPSKAPWYFMGFQELIMHFHPLIAIVIIPVSIIFILFNLPKIKDVFPKQGVWFHTPSGSKLAKKTALLALILTPVYILLDEYLLNSVLIFKHGILSFILLVSFLFLKGFYLKRKLKANKAEIIQTISIFVIITFIVLTLTGIYLRGEGMKLIF